MIQGHVTRAPVHHIAAHGLIQTVITHPDAILRVLLQNGENVVELICRVQAILRQRIARRGGESVVIVGLGAEAHMMIGAHQRDFVALNLNLLMMNLERGNLIRCGNQYIRPVITIRPHKVTQ